MDETLKHDASCLCECVSLTLERVAQIARKRGVAFPHTIILMSDNCVRECKNQYFMLYITKHPGQVQMQSHWTVKFAQSALTLSHRPAVGLNCPSNQLLRYPLQPYQCHQHHPSRSCTGPSLRSWIGMNSEIHCEKLNAVHAWKGHFQTPQQVGFAGGLLEDDTANHCFLMMLRRGMELKGHL